MPFWPPLALLAHVFSAEPSVATTPWWGSCFDKFPFPSLQSAVVKNSPSREPLPAILALNPHNFGASSPTQSGISHPKWHFHCCFMHASLYLFPCLLDTVLSSTRPANKALTSPPRSSSSLASSSHTPPHPLPSFSAAALPAPSIIVPDVPDDNSVPPWRQSEGARQGGRESLREPPREFLCFFLFFLLVPSAITSICYQVGTLDEYTTC